jgi:FlaA1/EpsC-like NDP-sugar epimerase
MVIFNVEETMQKIREDIKNDGVKVDDLSYVTNYHARILKMIRQKEELVIFGSGLYGKVLLNDLDKAGISEVKCFCDNNKDNVGKQIGNLDILSPQEAYSKYPKACFVVTPKEYENEILRQLIGMGVSVDNIILFNAETARMVD